VLHAVWRLNGKEFIALFHIELLQGWTGENHAERVSNLTDLQCIRHLDTVEDEEQLLERMLQ
jgi:hypothetical protein